MPEVETLYALFTPKTQKVASQWYMKLGAAHRLNVSKGKRYIVCDNKGREYKTE